MQIKITPPNEGLLQAIARLRTSASIAVLSGLTIVPLHSQVLELPQEYLEILPVDGEVTYATSGTSTEILDDSTAQAPALSGSGWSSYDDIYELHTPTADSANSSSTAYGSSHDGVLNDAFVYDPLNPTLTTPTVSWSASDFYHASTTSGTDAILSYTLSTPITITHGLKEVFVDLWGRDILKHRDNDIDINLYNGDYSTLVGSVTDIAISDTGTPYIRVSLQSLASDVTFDRFQIVGHDTSGGSSNGFTLAEMRVVTIHNTSTVNDENDILLASITHDITQSDDEGTVIVLTADSANSTASAYGSNLDGTINDTFTYDPLNSTATTPTIAWSPSDFYHAYQSDGSDAVLSYTLNKTLTTSSNGMNGIVMDLWGRDVLHSRDDDIDILLYNGDYSTLVGTISGVVIPNASNPHLRVDFSTYLADGISFDRIQIVGHNSSGASANSFTLAEVRLATVSTAAAISDYNSFEFRIGKGGAVYSIRNDVFGEAIPPQNGSLSTSKVSYNPWTDEVWQLLQVKTDAGGTPYYLHQAGTYQYVDHLAEPFYSPVLASGAIDSNTFVTINWVQHGHLDTTTGINEHGSYSIVYSKYRVVSAGVIEATVMAYNFGTDTLNWFNIPWGGVRDTSFGEILLGDPNTDGTVSGSYLVNRPKWSDNSVSLDNTGGWWLYAQSTDENAASLGLVVGKNFSTTDTDFVRLGFQRSVAVAQSDELTTRNYDPVSVIRRATLSEDDILFARYYFVVGSTSQVQAKVEELDLVESCTVEVFSGFSDPGSLYTWRRSAAGEMPTLSGSDPVHCILRDRPYNANFKPVFVIEYNGDFVCTYDPYKYTGDKPYLGTTEYIGLLGYANTTVYSEADLN